ncbi:MAG: glycogen/starch synthase, partial [Candidatus Gastranaerophilaceae bacterium]
MLKSVDNLQKLGTIQLTPQKNQNQTINNSVQQNPSADFSGLNVLGISNKANILAFGSTGVSINSLLSSPLGGKVKNAISAEAVKRINGEYPWPKIDKPKAWMVTAEDSLVMKVGGLAMVANDLPTSFNAKYGSDPEKHMDIVMPLYIGQSGKKHASLEPQGGNKYLYKTAEGKQIEVEKVKTIQTKVFVGKNLKYEPVGIYVGNIGNSRYILLENNKYFGINPAKENPSFKEGAYVLNSKGVDEVERFAFLSKAVADLMKAAKEEEIDKISAPNVIVANDWHAAPLSGQTRYLSQVKASKGKISAETADYLKQTPIIHIVHNLLYQGKDRLNSTKILNLLYEENANEIVKYAKSIDKNSSSLCLKNTYNQANVSLNLADKVVAVSPHYAEEIPQTSHLGYDYTNLLKTRQGHGTFIGITNGYSKSLIAPNPKVIDNLNKEFNPSEPFKVYDAGHLDVRSDN